MKKRPQPSLTPAEVIAVLRAQAQVWLEWPNVTSVGVGYKVVEGKVTDEISVQVTVAEKVSPAALKSRGFPSLPPCLTTPDGRTVPVDVVQRAYRPSHVVVPEPVAPVPPPAMAPRVRRRRRLTRVMPGISVGHVDALAGTIGAIVYDNRTGRACVLSNAHVLEGGSGRPGDVVVQPGRSDDSDIANNALGRLVRSHRGLAGDCAIATIEQRLFEEKLFELGVAPKRLARVALGDRVTKSARTTGVTRGIVVRIGVVIRHNYGGTIGVREIGGFEIGPNPAALAPNGKICDGGDSGALWMIEENGAVSNIAAGLHFAAQSDAATGIDHALAGNIDSIFERLDVSLQTPP